MANPVNRREFIGTAASGVLLAGGLAARPTEAAETAGWPKMRPVKVYVAYLGTGGAWPKPEFDAPAEVKMFQEYLAGVEKRLGDVKFTGGRLIRNRTAQAAELAKNVADADAVLLISVSAAYRSTYSAIPASDSAN